MKVTKIQKSTFDLSGNEKKKRTFQIFLNWYGESMNFYTTAITPKSALFNVLRQLSKKLNITFTTVKIYILNPRKDRYKIKEVLK